MLRSSSVTVWVRLAGWALVSMLHRSSSSVVLHFSIVPRSVSLYRRKPPAGAGAESISSSSSRVQ